MYIIHFSYYFKSNQWRCAVNRGVLKTFTNFTRKHLCLSLFLIKSDSDTGVFLWNLRNFKNTYFEEYPQTNASNHFRLMLPFHTTCKHRKTFRSLTHSGRIETGAGWIKFVKIFWEIEPSFILEKRLPMLFLYFEKWYGPLSSFLVCFSE